MAERTRISYPWTFRHAGSDCEVQDSAGNNHDGNKDEDYQTIGSARVDFSASL
jgi:hypothetical protein